MGKKSGSRAESGRPAQKKAPEQKTIQKYTTGKAKRLPPLAAIRANCRACMCGSRSLVADCPSMKCRLWPYRAGRKPANGEHRPLRAIRTHCLECVGSVQEVRACTGRMLHAPSCSLHEYRFGHNPARRHGRKPTTPIQEAIPPRSHGLVLPLESSVQTGEGV